MRKKSRQRDLILTVLRQHKDHPTAGDIYEEIHKEDPHVSLGTVYRNLNLLAQTGDILKIDDGSNSGHFDGLAQPHYHHVCTKCGAISDIDMPYTNQLMELVQASIPHRIETEQTIFYGTCEACIGTEKDV